MKQPTTWVCVMNSTNCRIYDYKRPLDLTLNTEVSHPENKFMTRELITDRPGHYKGSDTSRGSFAQATDPKETMIDDFTRNIANLLDDHRKKNQYEKLILIAPPHIQGLLLQHLTKHVKQKIEKNIQKDIIYMPDHELAQYLKEHAQFLE